MKGDLNILRQFVHCTFNNPHRAPPHGATPSYLPRTHVGKHGIEIRLRSFTGERRLCLRLHAASVHHLQPLTEALLPQPRVQVLHVCLRGVRAGRQLPPQRHTQVQEAQHAAAAAAAADVLQGRRMESLSHLVGEYVLLYFLLWTVLAELKYGCIQIS